MRSVLLCLTICACATSTRWAAAVEEPTSPSARKLTIEVTRRGFVPAELHARSGEVVTLELIRREDNTCAKRVRVYVADRRYIERALPVGAPVDITLRLTHDGEVGVTCAMQMLSATLYVSP